LLKVKKLFMPTRKKYNPDKSQIAAFLFLWT
jgi:hypothetical protein